MKRLTSKKLLQRLKDHIEEFGNAPIGIDQESGVVFELVEDGKRLMLINPNEAPDTERLKAFIRHAIPFSL